MLSRNAIEQLMSSGEIRVNPAPKKIGPNSIDLCLGDQLKTYHPTENRLAVKDPVSGLVYLALDPRNPPPLVDVPKTPEGAWLLVPGQFYLGCTLESTYCIGLIPHLDGRSTCGRLSIEAHKTAGVGDNGFEGQWTLEMEVTEPVLVRPGDRLFQVYFSPAWGSGLARIIQRSGTIPQSLEPLTAEYLLDVHALYGNASHRGHYQKSRGVRPYSPLD